MIILRFLLFPLSFIYGLVTLIRNKFFDWGIFKVYEIPVKSICIGNLNVGGTGKSPMVMKLVEEFHAQKYLVVLSRGYGRKTKGFLWVESTSLTEDVGDEPLQVKLRFKEKIKVAVCEDRVKGVKKILEEYPQTDLIILDDAYQHRWIKAGFTILLTSFSSPFFKDFLLPTGNLREGRYGAKRAQMVVLTKVKKEEVSLANILLEKMDASDKYYSSIEYDQPIAFGKSIENMPANAILVTGIANPEPLLSYLKKSYTVDHYRFSDHHEFNAADIEKIHQKIGNFAPGSTVIFTTEKDHVRLMSKAEEYGILNYPWYYLPISVEINDEINFKNRLSAYVGTI